jgi:hypothetical protein
MGAWGAGSFENDTALDWAAEISSAEDINKFYQALPPYDGVTKLDADLSERIVAAAEAVAAMMGRVSPDVPQDLRERLSGAAPSDELIEAARNTLSAMLSGSELVELWDEDADGAEEWNKAITGLIDRLNPELPYAPPPLDTIEQQLCYLTTCAFCDEPIAEGEIVHLEFRDFSSDEGLYISRGIYCHLPCLHGKLHSKHLLQNWKFDPDKLFKH